MCYSGYAGMATPKYLVATRYGDVLMDKCPNEKGSVHFHIPEDSPLVFPDGKHYHSLSTDTWNVMHGFQNWAGKYVQVKGFDPATPKKKLGAFLRYEDDASIFLDELMVDTYLSGFIPDVPQYNPQVVRDAFQLRKDHQAQYASLLTQMNQMNVAFSDRVKTHNENIPNNPELFTNVPNIKIKIA
jgi:hypothetical protein